jgi:hypothetical protein
MSHCWLAGPGGFEISANLSEPSTTSDRARYTDNVPTGVQIWLVSPQEQSLEAPVTIDSWGEAGHRHLEPQWRCTKWEAGLVSPIIFLRLPLGRSCNLSARRNPGCYGRSTKGSFDVLRFRWGRQHLREAVRSRARIEGTVDKDAHHNGSGCGNSVSGKAFH